MKEIILTLSIEETNLVLKALMNLPFIQVNGLIGKIQTQAQPQANPPVPEGEKIKG